MNAHPLPRCLLRLATTDPTSKRGWLKEDCGQQVVARGTESAWSANGEPLQQPGMEALWTEDVLLRCLLLHGPAGGNASLEAGAGGALPARRALRAAPRTGHPRVLLLRRGDQCKEVGEDIIQAILHTDVTKHNETMEDLLLYQMNKETLNIKEIAEEAGGLLKASRTMINAHWDANNSCKPWEVVRLAYSCMDDFSQGDKKDIGIPLGFLNDREKVYRLLKYPLFVVFMVTALIF
ncbi:unnamed protein product, partial [Effrenium voratum]